MSQASAKIQFTPEKYQQMQSEVARLTTERVAVMGRLKDAREMGDLSENGAYKYAKLELGTINRQLRELRFLLTNGEIFIRTAATGKVEFGSTVVLQTSTQNVTYTIVNKYESDPSQGKLSAESPLGSLLMGKKVGEAVELKVPAGTTTYVIIEIK